MKWFVLVFAILFGVIFLGGAVDLGSRPLFGHIDAILGTNALMSVHYGIFSFMYRGEDSTSEGLSRSQDDIEEFSERPLGIDNKKKYRELKDASDY